MRYVEDWVKTGLLYAAFALVGMLGLVVFALLAVAIRPLLIVAAIGVLLVGTLLAHVSPGVRNWVDSACESHHGTARR